MRTRRRSASCQPARSMSSRRPSSSSAASQYTPSTCGIREHGVDVVVRVQQRHVDAEAGQPADQRVARPHRGRASPPPGCRRPTRLPSVAQAARSGRNEATGTRRGIRSVAAMSPLTVCVTAAAPGVAAAVSRGAFFGPAWGPGSVADPADDVGEGGEVAQFEGVVAGHTVVAADGGEDFGLLDGVDAEVGFQVEVDVEQVGRIAGEFGDDADDGVGQVVAGGRGCGWRGCGGGRGFCVRRRPPWCWVPRVLVRGCRFCRGSSR